MLGQISFQQVYFLAIALEIVISKIHGTKKVLELKYSWNTVLNLNIQVCRPDNSNFQNEFKQGDKLKPKFTYIIFYHIILLLLKLHYDISKEA